MKRLLFFILTITTLPVIAQQSISLDECYNLLSQNYPLAKQSKLFDAQNKLDSDVIDNLKLPQFSLNAQATYQSDVIEIPIPNSNIEPLNKDQYRATFSVNQLLYNGRTTQAAMDLKSSQYKSKLKQVEVSLYLLKQQINQLYFSILLAQESELLLVAKEEQLKSKLNEVQSGIRNGFILPTSDKVLEAELLKIEQGFLELESNKASLIERLSSLISQPLEASTLFIIEPIEIQTQSLVSRPELELLQFKKEEIESSEKLMSKQNSPKVFGFATGGYGNPGLNMLDNSFQPFYTVGVKFQWNVFDWNSNNKQLESLAINKDIIDVETELFKLNTNTELINQQNEIEKFTAIIVSDEAIIDLREEVLSSADSQLKNGVITTSAYIVELTNLYEDENMMVRHTIQLQLAKANYNVIKGQ